VSEVGFELKKILALLTLGLIVVFLISGCGKSEEDFIKETVRKYNSLLSVSLRRANADRMEKITNPWELSRIDSYIMYLMKENKVVLTKLESISFTKLKQSKNRAFVETKERWLYQYADAKRKKPIGKPMRIWYKMKYDLEKKKERWIVDRVTVLSQKESEVTVKH
jgi:uncharacterized lipoprotein YehR (DUF1307 family)